MTRLQLVLLTLLLPAPLSAPGVQTTVANAANATAKSVAQIPANIEAYFQSLGWKEKKEFVWEGGASNSLAGRAICAAEGNCNTNGKLTSIASGHVDPGNHVNNMGRFSYQVHLSGRESMSIEEADQVQLNKLLGHTDTLNQRMQEANFQPSDVTLREYVSGLDVANQCPLCLTEPQGYVEHLKQVKNKGLEGEKAVEQARIQAYIEPSTGQYNAPGLRAYDDISKEESIRKDVQRREGEIQDALQYRIKEMNSSK